MNRELRRAVVSIVIVVTFALCLLIALPIVQRYSTAKLQEVAKTARPNEMATHAINSIYPSLAAVFGSMLIATGVGFVVARKLPKGEKSRKQARRS